MSSTSDGEYRRPTDSDRETTGSTRGTARDADFAREPDRDASRLGGDTSSVPTTTIPVVEAPAGSASAAGATAPVGQREVLHRQKDRFGGIKWGSAFFGWLTATGTAVILTALASAAGAAFGLATSDSVGQAAAQATAAAQNPATVQTAGIVSAVVILVVVLIAYYCGGYVAGRMARFNGARQGFAVWVWSIVVAVVVGVLAALAGNRFNILATLNGLPRLPIGEGTLTTGGIIAVVVALVAALVGALLGGLAGMRYHRAIDRAGFDE